MREITINSPWDDGKGGDLQGPLTAGGLSKCRARTTRRTGEAAFPTK